MAKTTLPVLLLFASLVAPALATEARKEGSAQPTGTELEFPVGALAVEVPTHVDPSKHYALYVPSSYESGERLPVLLILDPEGRAQRAAELFLPAAERYGWILVSSNDIRTDTAWGPNQEALSAVWQEIHRYPIDPRRIYTAGLSGGAVLSWILGQNTGALAGMISAGMHLQEGISKQASSPHWGAAGAWDFNYGGMRSLDEDVAEQGVPHWLEIFPGPHGWMPPELASQAVGWMELQAMRSERREVDTGLVDRLWTDWLSEAKRLDETGDDLGALRRLRQLEESFQGLRDVGELRDPIERLENSRRVARQLHIEEREDEDVQRYVLEKVPLLGLALTKTGSTDFGAFETNNRFEERKLIEGGMDESRVAEDRAIAFRGADVEELRRHLDLKRLRDRAEGSDWQAVAARRKLQYVAVQASVYLPREWMAKGEWRAARTVLQIATEAGVDTPRVWLDLARCTSRLDQAERAIAALQKATDAGLRDAEPLRSSEDFAPLREREDFRAIVAEVEEASVSCGVGLGGVLATRSGSLC